MNEKQKHAIRQAAKEGCAHSGCKNAATVVITWEFIDTRQKSPEHPLVMFVRCDEHIEEARAQSPQVPSHIRVIAAEHVVNKPLVFS